ncbi:MAG TPA: efflux RND transporter permease subunit [Thermoleophilaceae bacterium]|nr:efflux RND transporter permease subunit [Thermoleophilaceae bacterium]
MRAVVRGSLQFRLLVVGVAVAVMAYGVAELRDARVDVLPEFTPPYVEIQTEALGLAAEEVEQLITVPLEADLLNGVAGIETLRSKSVPGLSSIVMVFEPGTELFRARQLVQERLTQLGGQAFPNVSQPPTMIQPLSSSSRTMMIGLDPNGVSPIEASVVARWKIRPRLMGVPGVANVAIWGHRDQQLQVQVDPERLRRRGVTLNDVVRTAGNAQLVSPLTFLEASTPGTGGFVETPNQRLQVRHAFENLATPEALGKVPVEGTGGKLRLTDVAGVVEDHQPLIGDAVVNGGDGLVLVVEKFPGANSLEVTEGVQEALDTLEPGLSGIRVDDELFRPARFIEQALGNLALALLIGGILVGAALVAFLFEWRAAFIALITIPSSLIAAALLLDLLGQPLNAIAFAGLAGAVAVVVDDAVVSVENVLRRLRQHGDEGRGRWTSDVVLEASAEVRSPLAYATLIVLIAVVPVLVMGGRPGAFFEPLGVGYVLAVLASMVVALTLSPALSVLLFSRAPSVGRESPVWRWLSPVYGAALARALRTPRAAVIASGACVAGALAALPVLELSPIPSFKDRDVLVRLTGPPGTSEPKMNRITAAAGRELGSLPGVEKVGGQIGRAITGDRIVDVDSSELWVGIAEDADHEATVASVKQVVSRVPEVESDVLPYTKQQIRNVGALEEGREPDSGKELERLTGTDKPIAVRVYGQNLDVLRREAEKVRRVMSGVGGIVDPVLETPDVKRTLEVQVDLAKARRFGIKPGEVRRAEATLLQGIQVGSIFEEQKVFDVVVQGVPDTRRSVSSVGNLLIDRPGGGYLRLGDVADTRLRPSPTAITRDAVSRYIDVGAEVSGRSGDAVAQELDTRLDAMRFPLEYHAEVRQESTSQEAGGGRMLALALGGTIAIFLLLQARLRSWRLATLAFVTLPVALAGGVFATLVAGATLSLGALIGLLALLAIAARHAVLLVGHWQRLQREHGEAFGRELVARGARDRLAPTLTTASALTLLLLPLVVLGDMPGLEIAHPMAIVVLGGLVTSTLVSLFVLPALYLRFGTAEPGVRPEDELVYGWEEAAPLATGRDARAGLEARPADGPQTAP